MVKGQHARYINSAREKIVNKSWEPVRICINNECHTTDHLSRYISYFQERDVTNWVGDKYQRRLRYSAAEERVYQVDSLNNYLKNSGPSDIPTWLFLDSNSRKDGRYIVASRSPLYEDDGSGIEDDIFGISFLSDSEFVSSWTDRLGSHRVYYKLYNTPLKFYHEHKIEAGY